MQITKNKTLVAVIIGMFVAFYGTDIALATPKFVKQKLESSQECDNNVSVCKWNSKKGIN